jgi:hypothetical protein
MESFESEVAPVNLAFGDLEDPTQASLPPAAEMTQEMSKLMALPGSCGVKRWHGMTAGSAIREAITRISPTNNGRSSRTESEIGATYWE